MNNGADGSYEWIYNAETETFESCNAGVSNSKSILELVYAKASFTAFDYLVNSESNYDYLVIYVNGKEVYKSKSSGNNGIDITGSFAHTFNAGDVLRVVYQKDSSGNRGDDHGVLSNFVIYDGVPGVQITLDFNDANVENVTIDAELNAVVSSIEELVTLAPADTDARHFGGWYYDAEFTKPVNNTDTLLASATLYAKYNGLFITKSNSPINSSTVPPNFLLNEYKLYNGLLSLKSPVIPYKLQRSYPL
jgi:hypothetical protein